jgi:D-amino-acid oxidase
MHRTSDSGLILTGRRAFVKTAGAFAGLQCFPRGVVAETGFSTPGRSGGLGSSFADQIASLVSGRADAECISRITVCLRPFRASGPRLESERVGDKIVVHNYGHGGSGWSLSWGSAAQATRIALQASAGCREFAVIGAGIIGLTSALMLQRAGAQVAIYARDLTPNTRSWRATGTWAPDFRIALASGVSADFAPSWERMARSSFAHHQSFCNLPNAPVELSDRWYLSDSPQLPDGQKATAEPGPAPHDSDFVHLNQRLADLLPRPVQEPQQISFDRALHVLRWRSMTFNVTAYCTHLLGEFREAGGRTEVREFHSPNELSQIKEGVIINCPGYDARSMWADESIVPIRGQIAWLAAQTDRHYGVMYKDLFLLARQDGILLQYNSEDGNRGWNNTSEEPDPTVAERGVAVLRELYSRMSQGRRA